MPLKTFVKVGAITNLSDARYCAGMGVDMLGFATIEGQPDYLSPKQFQEIRGWVSGPRVVAEIYGLKQAADLNSILENYRPDFLELSITELALLPDSPLPTILRCTSMDLSQLDTSRGNVAYLLITSDAQFDSLKAGIPVLIQLDSTDNLNVLEQYPTAGVALSGSQEISPGLKTYDHLADVLEQLEVQD